MRVAYLILAISACLGLSSPPREVRGKTPAPHEEARALAKQLDEAGFFARMELGLAQAFRKEAAVPELLLAKYRATNPVTQAIILHSVDSILKRESPQLTKFPLAWAKEDLAQRRWSDALALATANPELFDLDARQVYVNALEVLWKKTQTTNPSLAKVNFPGVHHEYWQRGEAVRAGAFGGTVIARRFSPRGGSINGSCVLCDTIDFDEALTVSNSILITRDSVLGDRFYRSIVITQGRLAVTVGDIASRGLYLSCEPLPAKQRFTTAVFGNQTLSDQLAGTRETVQLDPKEMDRFWTLRTANAVGTVELNARGQLTVTAPAPGSDGLQKGDVLLEVNGREINSLGEIEAALPHRRFARAYLTVARDGVQHIAFGPASSR